eukprot:scaffold3362_cov154-Amphora_coffeaeformis.AAC.4
MSDMIKGIRKGYGMVNRQGIVSNAKGDKNNNEECQADGSLCFFTETRKTSRKMTAVRELQTWECEERIYAWPSPSCLSKEDYDLVHS